jgi:hypothetical protein
MSIDTTLAIIGLIVTILLGYLGLKYTLKYRKKTEIIFLKNSSLSLFKTIVKNLDEIEINFQGKKINENLILFKGTFFNNGNIDIEKSIVYKPLEIELPDNYSWVSNKIIDSSDGLNIELKQVENKLIFQWDLLKEGEHFTFDSLVEYKAQEKESESINIGRKLLKDININHRITDLKKIKKENSIPRPTSITGVFIMSIIILALVTSTSYYSFGQYLFPKYIVLTEVKSNSGAKFVSIKAIDEKTISFLDKDDDETLTISKNSFPKYNLGTLKIEKQKIDYLNLIGLGFISILYFIFWIIFLVAQLRERSLFQKLKNVAEKHNDIDYSERREIGLKLFEFKFR